MALKEEKKRELRVVGKDKSSISGDTEYPPSSSVGCSIINFASPKRFFSIYYLGHLDNDFSCANQRRNRKEHGQE